MYDDVLQLEQSFIQDGTPRSLFGNGDNELADRSYKSYARIALYLREVDQELAFDESVIVEVM